ncbi:MAG TPA: dTDP-4-dehydrorhamnose 3,5-epimerase [Gammaproteobacteria bacterium]|nr:dTDP-4-dehydrorhamnose 3,5-epimerase [Gammaproteobacteria bacterium]
MQIKPTLFPEVLLIKPRLFEDSRGFFYESFNQEQYKAGGITKNFVQDNISRSIKNTLRGMHYQIDKPQAKLVSVTSGEVFDVVVDIRKGSPTFGKWVGQILSDKNHCQLYIPEGFAHGFCVLSDTADFMYKCTDYYYPQGERGIRFDDPDVNIQWPIELSKAILSDKDKVYPRLKS